MIPKPPEGYRLLKMGEIIKPYDLYLSTTGKWEEAPGGGGLCWTVKQWTVIENGVFWATRIAPLELSKEKSEEIDRLYEELKDLSTEEFQRLCED